MSGLYGILDMCKWSTLAQQANIEVIGHNIANVNTPGYSRQRIVLNAAPSITTFIGQMGTGVRAVAVQREHDKFVNAQINFEKQILGNWHAQDYSFQRVEGIFNEFSEYGLGSAMNEFWNAWQSLADNPSGQAERVGLISIAETMARDFNKMYEDLHTLQVDTNSSIKGAVDNINALVDQIVELNEKISQIEVGQDIANDFRDQRESLLDELAEKIGFSYVEDDAGQVSIFLENGHPLVQPGRGWHLAVEVNATNNNFYDVGWDDGTGILTAITDNITRGELGGLLEIRDTIVPSYIGKVDKLAAGIINEMNKLHYYGYGLDGSTENNFFNPLSVSTNISEDNTGSASINVGTVYDNSVLTLDDYEIRFTGAATFEIYNVTDGTQVMDARIDGVVDNDGSFAYTNGTDIEFEGIRVVITDGAIGLTSGDIFTVDSTGDAAKNMMLNPDIVNDVNKIATSEDGSGNDNLNALAIAGLRNGNYMSNNTTSFDGYYSGLIGKIGVDAQNASRSFLYKQTMVEQVTSRRESISGVNLDEEMANLIRYQHAFTASARMITLVDEMMDELLNLV
ncbi:MAG: flagellar hook-associated protein FlgK [Deltaproteobacteria bacterium]|nr:flagellar hook-associated protein FlgK [Deltaproteobacteria bacterium]